MNILSKILICFFLLANCANVSNAQISSGILKTSEGFLAVINSDSLWFTIRLEEPLYKEPRLVELGSPSGASRSGIVVIYWILNIQMLMESDLPSSMHGKNPLISLMNWQTDCVLTAENTPETISDFIVDSLGAKSTIAGISSNAWYYSIDKYKNDFYVYFLDIYKNGEFIRIEYRGELENARTTSRNLLSQLTFYPSEIDLSQFQTPLLREKFGY
jgi:hypothetical protein